MGERADLALEARAIRQRWPMPEAAMKRIVYRAMMYADGKDPDNPEAKPAVDQNGRRKDFVEAARLSLRGMSILKDLSAQNQTDELMALRRELDAKLPGGSDDNPLVVKHDHQHAITLEQRRALLLEAVIAEESERGASEPSGNGSTNGDGPGPLGAGD